MNKVEGKFLVVDGQVFQSAARDRGMGRYSQYLLTAILEERSYSTVFMVLSKKSHAKDIDHKSVAHLFPGVELVYLDLQSTQQQKLKNAEAHNKKVINEFVSGLNIDPTSIDFLIPSPFQEPIVSVFPDLTKNFVIFYDLIPYLYHKRYADKMPFVDYLQRFRLLFTADRLLTISQAVRDDLAVYLGIPYSRTSVIDGAAIKSATNDPVCPPGLDAPEKFVLMPTSDDPRKNNLRAVLGFEEFNTRNSGEYKLIITSKIHRSERDRLLTFSRNIIFTGNIAEEELDWLYERACVVLFTPESEGLGLPILEAVQVNKRVVCSSLDVFKEISKDAFYYCNHEDQYSIAAALDNSVHDKRDIPKEEYARILKHYSWVETAKRAINALEATQKRSNDDKPRIAVFTPAPDGLSAVGKVVAETHAVLADYFDIDYYAEKGTVKADTRPNYLQHVSNYYPAESFSVSSYALYQAVFYHIGNSEYHLKSIATSLYLPGYVILHDTNITDAYRVMADNGIVSKERVDLEDRITRVRDLKLSKGLASLITNQLGIITHSQYASRAVREILGKRQALIHKVDLATQAPEVTPGRSYKSIRFGMAGIIADIKGIEVIEKLARNVKFQKHVISIFGYNYASPETMDRLQTYDNIELQTNLTDLDFVHSMRKLDVFVNYRMQYQGETSLSTLEAMRQGVVVVVRNIGWYAELPDDVVVKVGDPDELLKRLKELVDDPHRLHEISTRAIGYVRQHHSHAQYAQGMRGIIESEKDTDSTINACVRQLRQGEIKSKDALLHSEGVE